MENQDSFLPATPSDVIKVIQFKYYQIMNEHEEFYKAFLNGKHDLRMSRQLFTSMLTFVLLIKNYDSIKKDKEILKTFTFVEGFAKSRYVSKMKDIEPKILFDLVQTVNNAYHKLGLADIEVNNG